jgi:hypothetical protein
MTRTAGNDGKRTLHQPMSASVPTDASRAFVKFHSDACGREFAAASASAWASACAPAWKIRDFLI